MLWHSGMRIVIKSLDCKIAANMRYITRSYQIKYDISHNPLHFSNLIIVYYTREACFVYDW